MDKLTEWTLSADKVLVFWYLVPTSEDAMQPHDLGGLCFDVAIPAT
jgi:hypothetical protein